MTRLGLGIRIGGNRSSVAGLFGAGQIGFAYDALDMGTLYQDSAATTRVTAAAQPVGYVRDISGQGRHATQATGASRPQSGAGWIGFNGAAQWLQTPSVPAAGNGYVLVVVALRKTSDVATGIVIEATANGDIAPGGSCKLLIPTSTTKAAFDSRGSTNARASTTDAAYAAPATMLCAGIGGISSDTCILRINGVQVAMAVADQGTGSYSSDVHYIGARAGTSLFFNGRFSRMLVRYSTYLPTAAEIAQAEAWAQVGIGALE